MTLHDQSDLAAFVADGEGWRAVRRVLAVAVDGDAEDVGLAVEAELLGLLRLQDCWFTGDPVVLPLLGTSGDPDGPAEALPADGVAVPVVGFGRRFGSIVCLPVPAATVDPARRRTAIALVEVLGLVMGAAVLSAP